MAQLVAQEAGLNPDDPKVVQALKIAHRTFCLPIYKEGEVPLSRILDVPPVLQDARIRCGLKK